MNIKAIKKQATWGLVLGLSIGLAFAEGPGHGIDWHTFQQWALGLPHELGVWNPYWLKLIIFPLVSQPQDVGHALLNIFTFTTVLAVGHFWPILTYVLLDHAWVGNVDGLIILGIILARRRNHHVAGIGLFLQSIKPQYLPLSLYYIWQHKNYRIFIIPIIGGILSFVVYGNWLPEWLATFPPEPKGANVSLYPWTLPVWLLLPYVQDKERFVLAATIVSSPYFNQISVITLFAFLWPPWAAATIIVLSWLNPTLVGLFALVYTLVKSSRTSILNEIIRHYPRLQRRTDY
jgi:hypothetical protein